MQRLLLHCFVFSIYFKACKIPDCWRTSRKGMVGDTLEKSVFKQTICPENVCQEVTLNALVEESYLVLCTKTDILRPHDIVFQFVQ